MRKIITLLALLGAGLLPSPLAHAQLLPGENHIPLYACTSGYGPIRLSTDYDLMLNSYDGVIEQFCDVIPLDVIGESSIHPPVYEYVFSSGSYAYSISGDAWSVPNQAISVAELVPLYECSVVTGSWIGYIGRYYTTDIIDPLPAGYGNPMAICYVYKSSGSNTYPIYVQRSGGGPVFAYEPGSPLQIGIDSQLGVAFEAAPYVTAPVSQPE
jgi:hypothetical protein